MCEPKGQYSGTSSLTIPMENFILTICLFWVSTLTLQGLFISIFFPENKLLWQRQLLTVSGGVVDTISSSCSSISSQLFAVSSILSDSGGELANFTYQSLSADTYIWSSDLLIHYCFLHTHSFFICYGLGNIPPGFIIRWVCCFSRSSFLGVSATQEKWTQQISPSFPLLCRMAPHCQF